MLAVTAGELDNPVALTVLVEGDNGTLHGSRLTDAAARGVGAVHGWATLFTFRDYYVRVVSRRCRTMTIKQFDPIEELRPLRAGALEGVSNDPSLRAEPPLAYDVYRVADELCIDFDVPGVEPSSIHLALENQFLIVSVTREIKDAGVEVIERGRVHGHFERRLVLPGHWDLEELRASCANGVLHVRAPLKSPSATRRSPSRRRRGRPPRGRGVSLRCDDREDFAIDHERVGSVA